MSVSADTQERWRRFYERSTGQKDRDIAGELIQKAESRAFWQTCFMIGSTVFVGGLMTVFYTVLTASH
ncbi:MAG TPA: hypothetical protein VHL80_07735 [Polyangia bacterium]|nr:hypothetical protein [Polyangia bacterium]